MKNKIIFVFLIAAYCILPALLITSCTEEKPLRTLPMYGPVDEETKANHRIANFSLTDQDGKTITEKENGDENYQFHGTEHVFLLRNLKGGTSFKKCIGDHRFENCE